MPFASFTAGSASHWSVILVFLSYLALTVWAHRHDPRSALARWTRGILIFLNLTAATSTVASHYYSGLTEDLDNLLPLHLCDVMGFVAAFALLSRHPLLCELTYYLGLGATLQGLLTPNLPYDYPHPVFFSFFQLHAAVVGAALLLPLGDGWRPRRPLWKSILRVILISDLYLLTVYFLNLRLDTNFAFVMHKPENPSLFDHLGPHPWYLLTVQALAILVMALLSLPFISRRQSRRPGAPAL
ncbi:MAG: TIGR02206 family membrane protein [Verrucomicrobiota bacterium JB023]|nr:TIGR02206 family membrane protein [Verrucomicrobiota bacterium JB023]